MMRGLSYPLVNEECPDSFKTFYNKLATTFPPSLFYGEKLPYLNSNGLLLSVLIGEEGEETADEDERVHSDTEATSIGSGAAV